MWRSEASSHIGSLRRSHWLCDGGAQRRKRVGQSVALYRGIEMRHEHIVEQLDTVATTKAIELLVDDVERVRTARRRRMWQNRPLALRHIKNGTIVDKLTVTAAPNEHLAIRERAGDMTGDGADLGIGGSHKGRHEDPAHIARIQQMYIGESRTTVPAAVNDNAIAAANRAVTPASDRRRTAHSRPRPHLLIGIKHPHIVEQSRIIATAKKQHSIVAMERGERVFGTRRRRFATDIYIVPRRRCDIEQLQILQIPTASDTAKGEQPIFCNARERVRRACRGRRG